MKYYRGLPIITYFLLSSCVTPPNKVICVNDAPLHAHCAFMISGNDFDVDNNGQQYIQDGRNWNYSQLSIYSLLLPPDSYGAIKKFILNYCHENPNDCNYDSVNTQVHSVEGRLNFKNESSKHPN